MRRLLIVALLLGSLIAPAAPRHALADAGYLTYEAVVQSDGYVLKNGAVYTNFDSNDLYAENNAGVIDRTWMRWDISSIPDTAYVTRIEFRYEGTVATPGGIGILTNMTSDPSGLTAQQRYDAVAAGDTIYEAPTTWATGTDQSVTIGDDHDADCQGLMNVLSGGQNWYAIGFKLKTEPTPYTIRLKASNDAAADPKPTLYVEYYAAAPYAFYFDDAVYENGTDAGAVTVHASGETIAETFTVDGADWWYSPTLPELFYWDLGGGYGRVMYVAGAEENFTVTLPESTFAAYGFTVKDYTGKLGLGPAYLEAYRTVAAETLIERGRIYPGNPVPLNLAVGRTYHLKILWSDGSRYDWGYFVALSDTSVDLIVRGALFEEQAYTIGRFITVQAARPNATSITVDYADSRAHTVWLNITIRVRNGAVATQQSFTTDTVAYTWAGAGAGTDYAVTVNGQHQDQGEWGYGKILDAEVAFLPDPDLGTAFTFGPLDLGGILAYILTVTTLLSFSYVYGLRGLLAAMAVASMMSFIGWASWSYNLLALGWFFSVVANLAGGGRQ